MKMSIAQALRKKAELVGNIQKLQARIVGATTVTDGLETYSGEDYDSMVIELANMRFRLINLKIAIDAGNHVERNGTSVYKLIIERGEANSQLQHVMQIRSVCEPRNVYYCEEKENVVKIKCRRTAKQMDEQIDELQKTIRGIDDQICDFNGSIQIDVQNC